MSIKIKDHEIPNIVINTFMSHSGDRIFGIPPLITNRSQKYRKLRRVIKESGATIFTKSSTYQKHIGNFRLFNPFTWKYVKKIGSYGLVNAYGLTNKGVRANAPKIASACKNGFNVIPNFYPQFTKGVGQAIADTLEAMKIYSRCLGSFFWAVELSYSCPNDKAKIQDHMLDALACTKAVRKAYPNICIIVKISIVHPYEFAQELVGAGADIIHAINTIPYAMVEGLPQPSPLAAVGGGGVSGGPAFVPALCYNKGLRQRLPDARIIMGCGVMNAWDANKYFGFGADAVSICTVCSLDSEEAARIIEENA